MATPTFGTDGVRGLANAELTPEFTLALGRAAARVLGRGPWLVGRDTRRSGPMLLAALTAGLTAEGADVEDLGVLPTPAVAAACATRGLPGAMISASHNAFADNGVKLLASGGRKLPDEVEARIEAALRDRVDVDTPPTGGGVGAVSDGAAAATAAYLDARLAVLDGRRLEGLSVILDCANGAASQFARTLFQRTGATVEVIHDVPDGRNINDGCGSTHPRSLQDAVDRARAEGRPSIGFAFDGDADRVLAVAEDGTLVDGDQIIGLCAIDLRDHGQLPEDTVVVTVMSNLGLRLAMESNGIRVVETNVGDRYVLEALAAGGYGLGGEQSGHVIFTEHATTGDGMLTALVVADIVRRRSETLQSLAAGVMRRLPQVLVNVRVPDPRLVVALPEVQRLIGEVEAELGAEGRVLLRPSGTEPLVRVMAEAPTAAGAEAAVARLVAAVEATVTRP